LSDSLFLVGQQLTIADIAVYANSHRVEDCGFSRAANPAFVAWTERVRHANGADYPVYPYSIDPHSDAGAVL
ncbi:glutathione binding-like protein, partial [Rhizobium ruizarguesonis]